MARAIGRNDSGCREKAQSARHHHGAAATAVFQWESLKTRERVGGQMEVVALPVDVSHGDSRKVGSLKYLIEFDIDVARQD